MCACVFTEGEVKGMYRHGDEEQWLTAISPNHLDVRDTYCKRRVAPLSNKHTRIHTHMCLPPGPCGEVECISLLCPEYVGGGG